MRERFAMKKSTDILGLLGWLALSYAVSAIGASASINAGAFYAQLTQPGWAPPGWLFGPVWTTLFTMMGVAAWLVWRNGGMKAQRWPLVAFGIQLALNALWSWLFFAWKLGGTALAEVVLLWAAIAVTLVLFWRARRLAGLLLVPYLLWVSFATVLNFSLWRLNPVLLGG